MALMNGQVGEDEGRGACGGGGGGDEPGREGRRVWDVARLGNEFADSICVRVVRDFGID